jgi:hypothetical protein
MSKRTPKAELINLAERRHLYERPFKTKHRGRAQIISISDHLPRPCLFSVGDSVRGKSWKPGAFATVTEVRPIFGGKDYLIGLDGNSAMSPQDQFKIVACVIPPKGRRHSK